jgi:hypothetical protein
MAAHSTPRSTETGHGVDRQRHCHAPVKGGCAHSDRLLWDPEETGARSTPAAGRLPRSNIVIYRVAVDSALSTDRNLPTRQGDDADEAPQHLLPLSAAAALETPAFRTSTGVMDQPAPVGDPQRLAQA